MHQATLKVAGGKLLRVKIEGEETIQSIGITGDFFLHPEDALPAVEHALSGLPWPAEEDVYVDAVQKVLEEKKASFVGVSAQDIAQAVLMAKQKA